MITCEKCKRGLPDGTLKHAFAGYGYVVAFCVECCPREFDGMKCDYHDEQSAVVSRAQSGELLYKCRQCGEVWTALSVPDIEKALVDAIFPFKTFDREKGTSHAARLLLTHACSGALSDVGIADLIGARRDAVVLKESEENKWQ